MLSSSQSDSSPFAHVLDVDSVPGLFSADRDLLCGGHVMKSFLNSSSSVDDEHQRLPPSKFACSSQDEHILNSGLEPGLLYPFPYKSYQQPTLDECTSLEPLALELSALSSEHYGGDIYLTSPHNSSFHLNSYSPASEYQSPTYASEYLQSVCSTPEGSWGTSSPLTPLSFPPYPSSSPRSFTSSDERLITGFHSSPDISNIPFMPSTHANSALLTPPYNHLISDVYPVIPNTSSSSALLAPPDNSPLGSFRLNVGTRKMTEAGKARRKAAGKYLCRYCNATLTGKGNLEYHINSHLGISPYPCEFCGKAFKGKGDRYRHRNKSCKERRKIENATDNAYTA